MSQIWKLILGASMLAAVSAPAVAGVVHKWVDANGITHYSDSAPEANAPVTRIDLATKSGAAKDDFYSIANQWQRLQQERQRRDRIELEQQRLKAAQADPAPRVVYVEKPAVKRKVVAYPRFKHRKPGYKHRKSGYKRAARIFKHRYRKPHYGAVDHRIKQHRQKRRLSIRTRNSAAIRQSDTY